MFVVSAFAQVETWKIDPAHSAAQFAVRHMGISTVRGEFKKISGSAGYDIADPAKRRLTSRSTQPRLTLGWICETTICAAQTSWTCRSIPPLLSNLSGPRQQVPAR